MHPLILLLIVALFVAVLVVLFSPERGLIARWREARRRTERILREDALKHIHKYEMSGHRPTLESIAGALHITLNEAADLVAKVHERNLLQMEGGVFRLTPTGRDSALHIIRVHRLWERYLADETGVAEAEWHDWAERYEHTLSPAQADALSAQLGNPTHDPHGDPIPTADGRMVSHQDHPLTAVAIDEPVRIVHVEDEPEAVYAQLVAEGLHPGMVGRVTEISPQRIRFWADGEEHILAPIVAANISVVRLSKEPEIESTPHQCLSDLKPGEKAKVVSITRACRRGERRRFMDLGIVPGTVIEAEMSSPSGDPTAYRILDAVIGLRRDQAKSIYITRVEEAAQ
ncbi:metal-dependent transcriptional regulator [Acidobacteria bacterium AH-259-D05]|nr:metal-dependent transcriptional regulator [Acidobacteria bacterium AH-259-D05]